MSRSEEVRERMLANELKLREILWYHHGCGSMYLYGDDGELQCSNPAHSIYILNLGIDFLRDTPDQIQWKLSSREFKLLYPYPIKEDSK
jgi:hypothetical protein